MYPSLIMSMTPSVCLFRTICPLSIRWFVCVGLLTLSVCLLANTMLKSTDRCTSSLDGPAKTGVMYGANGLASEQVVHSGVCTVCSIQCAWLCWQLFSVVQELCALGLAAVI